MHSLTGDGHLTGADETAARTASSVMNKSLFHKKKKKTLPQSATNLLLAVPLVFGGGATSWKQFDGG